MAEPLISYSAEILPDEASRLDAKSMREKIVLLESEMAKHEQVEIKETHYFAKGIYAREIFIPAGTLLTGKIHKTEHLNIISKGSITVVTEEGTKRVYAPCTIVSPPGTKRAGYAHEDTVWTTIHGTEETDLEQLEIELIAKDFDDKDLLSEIKKLEAD